MPDQFPSPTDPQTGLPASPTGTPLLPPAVARWATLVVVLALAVLGALVASFPESRGLQIGLAVTTAIAAVLGIASPGLRRAISILLLVAVTVTGTSCAWWKAHPTFQQSLKECGSRLVSAEVTGLLPDVQAALTGQPADWQGQLDQLVLRGGEAAICAIAAFVQALQSGQGGSEVNPVETYERAQRAAYLEQYLRGVSR